MSEFSEYALLSEYYDRFTDDVPYERWADYFEQVFEDYGSQPHTILDLACGTGSLTRILSQRGYEMIGVDLSEDMLMVAMENCADLEENRPIFLNQSMDKLDLYGTIDACVCCLDSVNYVTDPEVLREALRRVQLFLVPGGLFLFDINTRAKLEGISGQSFVREDEEVFCVWQAIVEGDMCRYEFDIFELNEEGAWNRYQEHHAERIYEPEELTRMLREAGFYDIRVCGELSQNPPRKGEQRIFLMARADIHKQTNNEEYMNE